MHPETQAAGVLASDDDSLIYISNSNYFGNSIVKWDHCGCYFLKRRFLYGTVSLYQMRKLHLSWCVHVRMNQL